MAFLRLFYSVPAFRRWRRSLGRPCPPGRSPRFEHRQHFLGEELQAPLRDVVRRAAEAEGDVEFEIADDLPALLQIAQDLVGRAPARRLHEAGDGAVQAGAAGDLRLLLIGIVARHRLEVLAQALVVMEVADRKSVGYGKEVSVRVD